MNQSIEEGKQNQKKIEIQKNQKLIVINCEKKWIKKQLYFNIWKWKKNTTITITTNIIIAIGLHYRRKRKNNFDFGFNDVNTATTSTSKNHDNWSESDLEVYFQIRKCSNGSLCGCDDDVFFWLWMPFINTKKNRIHQFTLIWWWTGKKKIFIFNHYHCN